jgi:hypothetical protein
MFANNVFLSHGYISFSRFSRFLTTTFEMKILISYKNNKGIATIIWLNISGGVIIAEAKNITT